MTSSTPPPRVTVDLVRSALRAHPTNASPTRPWASVLCLLRETPLGLAIILERRPMGPSFFGGHLSFPGGKLEASDADALAAAVRETDEELGIPASDLEVLGLLSESIDPRGRDVSCFVARHLGDVPPPRSALEVEETLVCLVDPLIDPHPRPPVPGHYVAQGHESRLWPANEKLVQYWPLLGESRSAVLWGFTAGLVSLLLNRTVGWEPPHPPRIVTRWEDLQPEPSVPR